MGYLLISALKHLPRELYVNSHNMQIIKDVLLLAAIDLRVSRIRDRHNSVERLPISLDKLLTGKASGWLITAEECLDWTTRVRDCETVLRMMSFANPYWEMVEDFLHFCAVCRTAGGFYVYNKPNPITAAFDKQKI